MPALFIITMLIIAAALIAMFVHDARRAREQAPPPTPEAPPRQRQAGGVHRPKPSPAVRKPAADSAVDSKALASHVKHLREAVDGGLISREEAVASIVRQTGGRVGEEAAHRLLHQRD